MSQNKRNGAPSRLDDPVFLKLVAECFAAGMSRQEMCDELEVKDKDTITRWKRDPRVKAIVNKLIEDRAMEINRKVDSIIAGRLSQSESLSMKDLIMVRKEFGGITVGRKEIADDAVTAGALRAMEEDPDLLERMMDALEGAPSEAEVGSE